MSTPQQIESREKKVVAVSAYNSQLTTRELQPTIVHGGDDVFHHEGVVGHDDTLD